MKKRLVTRSERIQRRSFITRAAGCCGMAALATNPIWADESPVERAIRRARVPLMYEYRRGYSLFFGEIRYGFSVFVDSGFSRTEREVIRDAMDYHFTQASHAASIAEHAVRKALFDRPKGGSSKLDLSGTNWQWHNALYGRVIPFPIVKADDPVGKRIATDDNGHPIVSGGENLYLGQEPVPGWATRSDNKPTKLFIYRIDDNPRVDGLGWVGIVSRDDPEYRFSIGLNGNRMTFSTPAYWAGVIVHEMLHNLGYTHPKYSERDYDKYFINVFERQYARLGSAKADSVRTFPRSVCGN